MTGIEHLTNPRELSIEYTQVHTVDLRNNPNVNDFTMTDSPLACVTLPHGRQLYVYTPESNVSYKVANKTPITEIDPDFDVSRVSNTSGGNFNGGVVSFTSSLFSYDYRANDLHTFRCKLNRNGGPAPDYQTFSVTLKIQNGRWADGTWADKTTEPKTVHLTLTDGRGTLPANEVPAGMIPDRGYKDGSRDMIPDTSVNAVTKKYDPTYTFIEAPEAGIPQNPDATIYEDGKPVPTRDKVSRAIKYEVYRSVNGGSYQLLTTMKGTSLRDGTAKSGQTCKYRVKAICSNRYGNSALSCIDTVKVK